MSDPSTGAERDTGVAKLSLTISDKAIATLVAHHAAHTDGVARLQPFAAQAAREALTTAARRATSRFTGQGSEAASAQPGEPSPPPVDTSAVEVDRQDGTGKVRITVRLVATCDPPIIEMATALQETVTTALATQAGVTAAVVVEVVDVDL